MKDEVIQLLNRYPEYAIAISIALNMLVAIFGLLPSVFITAANVLFFGFWQGTLVSIAGEAAGALVAFLLYRVGFKQNMMRLVDKYPSVARLVYMEGGKAFLAIFSLRLLPFVPSGLITFAAAIGKVSVLTFVLASSIGKIPALFIEAYAALQVSEFGWQGKLILLVAGIYLLYLVYRMVKK